MEKVVITFDEVKPHWAEAKGFDKEAEALGIRNLRLTGDFDSKITRIYGEVDNFEEVLEKFNDSVLSGYGSLNRCG